MEHLTPPFYYKYNQYLKSLYGKRAWRVGVDAQFGCPHRSNSDKRGKGGCIFCEPDGSRSGFFDKGVSISIKNQVDHTISVAKERYRASLFLLYFQAYSSTYAPISQLKEIYDYTLSLASFKQLIVSTRPDCINEEITSLLASYQEGKKESDFSVWVELGLQSSHNRTLKRINRGHSVETFLNSYNLLKSKGLKTVIHLITGLPDENSYDINKTATFVASLNPDGVKIHNLQVPAGTLLREQYEKGEFSLLSGERHLQYTANIIERLPPETVILRISTDIPPDRGTLPGVFLPPHSAHRKLEAILKERGSWQGKFYKR